MLKSRLEETKKRREEKKEGNKRSLENMIGYGVKRGRGEFLNKLFVSDKFPCVFI